MGTDAEPARRPLGAAGVPRIFRYSSTRIDLGYQTYQSYQTYQPGDSANAQGRALPWEGSRWELVAGRHRTTLLSQRLTRLSLCWMESVLVHNDRRRSHCLGPSVKWFGRGQA
jgi:hypothetical protein